MQNFKKLKKTIKTIRINLRGRQSEGGEQRIMRQDFEQMVKQYERLVYTICYQFTHDHALSEDLAQETFLSAYKHLNTCPEGAEKPWLARIAANKAKDHLKSAYNRKVAATEDDDLTNAQNAVAYEPAPEELVITSESVQRIKDYILALKEPYYLVAVEFFIKEKSIEEISRALDRPPKTVHTQIYRAKQILKEQITKGGR